MKSALVPRHGEMSTRTSTWEHYRNSVNALFPYISEFQFHAASEIWSLKQQVSLKSPGKEKSNQKPLKGGTELGDNASVLLLASEKQSLFTG